MRQCSWWDHFSLCARKRICQPSSWFQLANLAWATEYFVEKTNIVDLEARNNEGKIVITRYLDSKRRLSETLPNWIPKYMPQIIGMGPETNWEKGFIQLGSIKNNYSWINVFRSFLKGESSSALVWRWPRFTMIVNQSPHTAKPLELLLGYMSLTRIAIYYVCHYVTK